MHGIDGCDLGIRQTKDTDAILIKTHEPFQHDVGYNGNSFSIPFFRDFANVGWGCEHRAQSV